MTDAISADLAKALASVKPEIKAFLLDYSNKLVK